MSKEKDFEKTGAFYLGKYVDSVSGKTKNEFFLYDSKNLTTHAVCVGMTGSGKTGLGIALLEEAGLDNIPAIIIDPKGDLSNLLLTFPNLSPDEFKPWIDASEASRKEMSIDKYAQYVSKTWETGLSQWDEDAERIGKLKNTVDFAIYTPASQAGIPVSVLNSFAPPSKEELADVELLRERILSTTSSLLVLLGLPADPIKSREHILISTIIQEAWKKEQNLNIAELILQVQKPLFKKVGALDIDTFYPPKDRMQLSINLNNLLASPTFRAWTEGEPLDIKQFLYNEEGKPKLSIFSIAHLSDSERMFFVTLLLNQFLTWMRGLEGTSSLRALLYMDEIFGFFPPTASPPSKLPMLTLLKQARAYGVGIVLVTQNPVDLDYKGLANCGSWFIGKLQTERDKARVIEGLQVASNGEVDTKALDKLIALTGNRVFILRSIYEKTPILFETRWTLSYLRGPITLAQIATLREKFAEPIKIPGSHQLFIDKPTLPHNIQEYFINTDAQKGVLYQPCIAGIAKLHFVDSKKGVDCWKEICIVLAVAEDGKPVSWDEGKNISDYKNLFSKEPKPESSFEDLPLSLTQEKNYTNFAKSFSASLYQNQTYTIYQIPSLRLTSKEEESEADFKTRLEQTLREKRDEMKKKIRAKYADKMAIINEKIKRAQSKVEEKKQKLWIQKISAWISFFTTLLGTLLGRKITKGTISGAGTSLRRATQVTNNSQSTAQAEENVQSYQQQLEELEGQLNNEIALQNNADIPSIESIVIRPRKTDIAVEKIIVVWCPSHLVL